MPYEEGFCVVERGGVKKVPYISKNLFQTRQNAANFKQLMEQAHHPIQLAVEFVKRPMERVALSKTL